MPVRTQRWIRINTDRMAPEFAPPSSRSRRTYPGSTAPAKFAGAQPAGGGGLPAYVPVPARPPRRAARRPAARVGQEQVSFVFRATRVYGLILRNLHNRRYLRDGADRSIQLEQLGTAQVPPRDEVESPTKNRSSGPCSGRAPGDGRGDIPFFTARASSDALILSPGRGDRRVLPGAELRSRLERARGTRRGRSRAAGGVYRRVAVRPPGPREYGPAPRCVGRRGEIWPDRRRTRPSSPRRSTWRRRSGRALSAPRTVARRGSRPSTWSRRSATNCSPWTSTSTAGRAASRCFSRPPSDSPWVRLRRAGAGRPPPAAKRAGPPSGSSRRDDGYRRSLGPRLGRVLPAPRKPSSTSRRCSKRRAGRRSHHRRSHRLRPGSGRHRRAAGAILSLLALYEVRPDRRILERAIACGEHLIEARTATDGPPRVGDGRRAADHGFLARHRGYRVRPAAALRAHAGPRSSRRQRGHSVRGHPVLAGESHWVDFRSRASQPTGGSGARCARHRAGAAGRPWRPRYRAGT